LPPVLEPARDQVGRQTFDAQPLTELLAIVFPRGKRAETGYDDEDSRLQQGLKSSVTKARREIGSDIGDAYRTVRRVQGDIQCTLQVVQFEDHDQSTVKVEYVRWSATSVTTRRTQTIPTEERFAAK